MTDDTDDLAAARGIMVAGAGGLLFWAGVIKFLFGIPLGAIVGNIVWVLLAGAAQADHSALLFMMAGAVLWTRRMNLS